MSVDAPKSNLKPAEWLTFLKEYPDFKTDISAFEDALHQAAHPSEANMRNNNGFSTSWTQQGPANIGARVNCIAVHPTNQNIVYIGYSTGGVWKTTDGGQTWNAVFKDQTHLAIGHIAIAPANPNTVYVGTGDPNIGGYPFVGNGVWKSIDSGATWSNIGLAETRIIGKIIVHPTDPNTLFVATMGLPMERTADRGLYKTSNGGATWQKVLYIGEETGIIDLIMHPANPNILYCTSWDRIRNNQESIVSGPNAKIWKTTNGGSTWTSLSGGLPQGAQSRIGLAFAPDSPEHLWAVYVGTDLYLNGLYESFNGGQTWVLNPGDNLDPEVMSNFGWYFGKIYVNPFNKNDIWVDGVRGARSVNGGQSWDIAIPWDQEVHADNHDMAFLNASTILLATDGGLYKTTDGGQIWNKIENIPTTQFYRVAYNPLEPSWYIGGAQDNGTVIGNASGLNNWFTMFGGDGFQAIFHPTNPDIFYAEYQNGNFWGYDVDAGWFAPNMDGLDPTDRYHWDMRYIMSPHDPEVMYTGTQRVYRSDGHPPVWYTVSDDLTDGVIFGPRYHVITALEESPLVQDLLYVGTSDGNVWRGSPFDAWTNITGALPDRYVSCVKPSPNLPNRVYVAHTGYKSNDNAPHLHRSDNQGATWAPIDGNLPDLAINDIFVMPGHQDSAIFVATDGGVYGTLDAGVHWERLGAGMPIVPVYDMKHNLVENTLVAGTFGWSILSFPLDSLVFEPGVFTYDSGNKPFALTLAPNPATAFTRVTLEGVWQDSDGILECWSVTGKKIWVQQLPAAPMATPVHIPTHNLPAGAYVVAVRKKNRVMASAKFIKI